MPRKMLNKNSNRRKSNNPLLSEIHVKKEQQPEQALMYQQQNLKNQQEHNTFMQPLHDDQLLPETYVKRESQPEKLLILPNITNKNLQKIISVFSSDCNH